MNRLIVAGIAFFSAASSTLAAECQFEPIADAAGQTLARPVAGSVVREFGLQYDELLKKKTEHSGVDLEAASGEAVYAARGGKVVEAGQNGELGKYLRIDHGGGLITGYGHLASFGVASGACVAPGQEIGKAGATGMAPGPQVHFEVLRDGTPVNPLDFLP